MFMRFFKGMCTFSLSNLFRKIKGQRYPLRTDYILRIYLAFRCCTCLIQPKDETLRIIMYTSYPGPFQYTNCKIWYVFTLYTLYI